MDKSAAGTRLAAKAVQWLRWKWLLASCRYDPATDDDIEDPSEDDFLIVGCPRSGTSLLAAQLFRPPQVVTCLEPWDGLRMPVAELMRDLRTELERGRLSSGRLDVDTLRDEGQVTWMSEPEQQFSVSVDFRFQLGVKWPTFWRYLEHLDTTRFLVCVREPADVIASFATTPGRLRDGYDYDVAFNREMNRRLRSATGDSSIRRALMWEYIHSRIAPHVDRPNVIVIKYERWFTEPQTLLDEIGDFLGLELDGSIVNIRPSESKSDSLTRSLVAQYCRSASLFGYET